MNSKTKSIIAGVIAAVLFFIAVTAFGATNTLPKNVGKFQDGEVTCYTYYKSISCLKGVAPAPSKGNLGA